MQTGPTTVHTLPGMHRKKKNKNRHDDYAVINEGAPARLHLHCCCWRPARTAEQLPLANGISSTAMYAPFRLTNGAYFCTATTTTVAAARHDRVLPKGARMGLLRPPHACPSHPDTPCSVPSVRLIRHFFHQALPSLLAAPPCPPLAHRRPSRRPHPASPVLVLGRYVCMLLFALLAEAKYPQFHRTHPPQNAYFGYHRSGDLDYSRRTPSLLLYSLPRAPTDLLVTIYLLCFLINTTV